MEEVSTANNNEAVSSGRGTHLALLVCAIVILVSTAFALLRLSLNAEFRSQQELTLQSTQKINEQISQSIGSLYSMVASHQTSPDGFTHRQFEMIASNLVEKQVAVTATGRYDHIPHEDLDYYAGELQVHGVYAFEPKTLDYEGNVIPLEEKPHYNALISFFPQHPKTAKLIGIDLNDHFESFTALSKSTSINALFTAPLPLAWVAEGQLNVFASSYYGHYVPELSNERKLQTDGGYFITLDLQAAIAHSTGSMFPMSVAIALNSSDYYTAAKQPWHSSEKKYGTVLFGSRSIEHNLNIGSSSATITYKTPAGVTSAQLISALSKTLALLFVFCFIGVVLVAQRASRAQIKANERAIAREKERALVTLSSLQDAVITTDHEDKIDYLNPAALAVLKADREDLIGLPVQDVTDRYFKEEQVSVRSTVSENLARKKSGAIVSGTSIETTLMRLISDNTGNVVFNCHSSDILNGNRDKIGSVLTMRDMSNEHALTTELAHQATHDALTGLPNRRQFESTLEDLLNPLSGNTSIDTIVGYIDLDQFKLINDTVGHAAGDDLLKKLAIDLDNLTPANIEVARLGGDEFGFISSGTNVDKAESVARLFYDFFQTYVYHAGKQAFSIRASIGLSSIQPHHITVNDVLSEVDIACYTAKDMGRNGYVIYDVNDEETKDREGEMRYLPLLQTALKENRFVLYTQPIVSTQANNTGTHHYECLIRLINDDGSIITPYKFIVAAERYDLITDIDKWVINNAFSQISEFIGTELEGTIFSINLSGQSAVDTTMPAYIDDMLQKYSIDPTNICFELTETAVVSNLTQAQKLITSLREKGCTIALDDFGAGASSFGYLKNLEVDYLKIDGQFVREITSNKVDFEMVRSMKNVSQALGIKTIAEFVENEEIMQALRDINIDYAQGYHTGKPSPMDGLTENLSWKRAA